MSRLTPACLRLALGLLLGAVTVAPALAAEDGQIWTNEYVSVKLSSKWVVSEELTERFSNHKNGLYEVESNTLLGYRLTKTITAWAGYTHNPQYSSGDFTTMEHRAREQITFDKFAKIGPGVISARIRTEQRWRNNADGAGWRLRPFVRYTIPFRKGSATGITFTSEPFFNLNTTAFQTKSGLDRMRNVIAITTPIAKHLTGEFGYMNQHIFFDGKPDESDHIAWISINASL
jgi:hypothetical protein